MTLANRFRLIVGVSAAGLVALAVFWLSSERQLIESAKRDEVRNLVETATGIITRQHALERTGSRNQNEAQTRAIEAIRAMRYANDNYFFIADANGKTILNALHPELEGRALDGLDPKAARVFTKFADLVRREGNGFVSYEWAKPDSDETVRKISFVQGFEPWGWIVGSGVYMDDVDDAWKSNAIIATALAAGCLLLLFVVSKRMWRSIFHRLNFVVERMGQIARGEGDFAKQIATSATIFRLVASKTTHRDEIDVLTLGFLEMATQLQKRDGDLKQQRERLEEQVAQRTSELRVARAQLAAARAAAEAASGSASKVR